MKALVITPARMKKELLVLAGAFAIANAINLAAILYYGTPMEELMTMWWVVVPLTVPLYLALALPRALIALARARR